MPITTIEVHYHKLSGWFSGEFKNPVTGEWVRLKSFRIKEDFIEESSVKLEKLYSNTVKVFKEF